MAGMTPEEIAKLQAEYLSGQMDPERKAVFEEAMQRGLIPPPPATLSGFGGVPIGGEARTKVAKALDPSGYFASHRYGGVMDPPGEDRGRSVPAGEMRDLLAADAKLGDMNISRFADTEARPFAQQMPSFAERSAPTRKYPEGRDRGDVARRREMGLDVAPGSARFQPVRRKPGDPLVQRSRMSLMDDELLELLNR